jgi:hypothetical protein
LDHLESQQTDGIQDENTINALREYLLVLRLRGSAAVDEIDRVTCRAMKQVPQSKMLCVPYCRLLLGTASSYITCRRLDEAEEILDRVGAHLPTSPAQDYNSQRVLPTYFFIMGFLRYVTGRMDEAVNYFLQTYYVLEKARGPSSSAVADILLALVDFPGLLQKPQDVEHWQKRFAQVQAEMIARATSDTRPTALDLGEGWDGPLDTDVNTGMW